MNNRIEITGMDREALVKLFKENLEEIVKETASALGYIHPEQLIGKRQAAKMMGLDTEKKSWHMTMSQYQNVKYHDPALPSYRNLGQELQFKVKDIYAFLESKRHDPKDL